MKKLVLLCVALLIVAFTIPALGQNIAPSNGYNSSVQMAECITYDYHMLKLKLIAEANLSADVYLTFIFKCFEPDGRAIASVFKKQINQDNDFCVTGVTNSDKIDGSFKDFKGIGQANQSSGSMNNQANVVNAAVINKDKAYASAEVTEVQWNTHVSYLSIDPALTSFTDLITNSFNDFNGVGQANQSAGYANNQNNVVNVAFSTKGALVASSDVQLEQVNVNNFVKDSLVTKTNTITASFNGFQGVGQANQSAGSFNNQANIVSFAGTK